MTTYAQHQAAKANLCQQYTQAFEQERAHTYPVVDAFERRMGYMLEREHLEEAARVLACPLKVNPPNWQHGRVLYAAVRKHLATVALSTPITLLDIGTAKGFSALCLKWALDDAALFGSVISIDVIDPASHAQRNTVAECDGLKTLAEILEPWPEAQEIAFLHDTGLQWLKRHADPITAAFVDGKHDEQVVASEGVALACLQTSGDLAIFDDVHIPGVWTAVQSLKKWYDVERLDLLPNRAYAIGVRH